MQGLINTYSTKIEFFSYSNGFHWFSSISIVIDYNITIVILIISIKYNIAF